VNLLDAVEWCFTPWEKDVRVTLFGRAVFPCRVLGSTSCNAAAFRDAITWLWPMAMALAGVLSNAKRGLRGRFSALSSRAPWHISLPPGEGQPSGSPTKALLYRSYQSAGQKDSFSRCAVRDRRKQRPEFLYTFSACFN